MNEDEKKKRREAVLNRWKELSDLLDPCEFCGRMVLIGVCCNAALDSSKKEKSTQPLEDQ